jgi:hypothetical protein
MTRLDVRGLHWWGEASVRDFVCRKTDRGHLPLPIATRHHHHCNPLQLLAVAHQGLAMTVYQ